MSALSDLIDSVVEIEGLVHAVVLASRGPSLVKVDGSAIEIVLDIALDRLGLIKAALYESLEAEAA